MALFLLLIVVAVGGRFPMFLMIKCWQMDKKLQFCKIALPKVAKSGNCSHKLLKVVIPKYLCIYVALCHI